MKKCLENIRCATRIGILGVSLQLIAFIIPYLEYFEVVKFGYWFLGMALFLNLFSIFCLLFFFVALYRYFKSVKTR